ncbi:MAG: PspA/IM30 family protein [Lachnospiraceae bacterium]|nr:PspA/IM30 family protein [Lachnospiraceae bacterium]
MGILSRFKDIMSANINALLDKVEDPEKMIDQCLRNMNNDLAKVKQETASVMAQEKACKRQVDDCQADIDKMQSFAVKALTAGNEEDAKRFLAEKAKFSAKLADLQANYAIAHENSQKMRDMHDKLSSDIKELEARKETIKGKLAVAKAQEKINQMTSSVTSANNSISSFERYEALANKKLDKAQAVAELNASNPTNSIKDLTAKYVNDPNVDAELEALKASLGMNIPTELPQ